MNFWQTLPKPFFVLAPMDDVTDTVFRQLVSGWASPDVYFTEFVNVDGLQSPGRAALMPKLQYTPAETPLVAQVWGKTPEHYYQTARELTAQGYAGIDINMGCPDKTIVKNGCCSALINDRALAAEIIAATKEGAAGKVPVSIKTRLGFNRVDLTWHEFLLEQELDALIVHGRTRKEMSLVPAQWDVIGQICELRNRVAPGTALVGNGDVGSRAQGLQLAEQYGLDGIMIGRGVFADPFVFAPESPWPTYTKAQRLDMYRQHIELFDDTWRAGERKLHTLNRFCKIYISGFDGAKELRDKLMRVKTPSELLALLAEAQ